MHSKHRVIKALFYSVIVFMGVCAQTAIVTAQDNTAPAKSDAMDKMKQEMMEKWREYATPGEGHKALEPFVGSWNYVVTWWEAPGSEPQKSTGTGEFKWILGGRFLEQTVNGTMMGQEFQGLGLIGYDNSKDTYNDIWMDNMGTGIMSGTGTYDSTGKKFVFTGTLSCPMEDQKDKPYRSITTIVSPNQYTYEMYTTGPDNKEFRAMEIVSTKKQ